MMELVLRDLDVRMVLAAYADDDLVQVEACQTVYSAAFSAQVNWVKSSSLMGKARGRASSFPPVLQAMWWSTGTPGDMDNLFHFSKKNQSPGVYLLPLLRRNMSERSKPIRMHTGWLLLEV
ncbi:unnamed protein product [Caretta caretta]